MKYLLDTNIILILFQGRYDELRTQTKEILANEKNVFFTSVISLNEISQLYRKKKIEGLDYEKYNTAKKLLQSIIKTLSMVTFLDFSQKHAFITSQLTFVPKHNDPNDLAIIAHAMGEKMTIISTDKNFPFYKEQGAKVVHNQR